MFVDAFGLKPVVAITLLHREESLLSCGLDADTVAGIVAAGVVAASEADALRREGDVLLRKGDAEGLRRRAPLDNARVAALAATEAAAVETLAGERLGCVLERLSGYWDEDRARGAGRRDAVSVTCNVFATQFAANTSDEVAIPDYCIKFANLGWETCSPGYGAPPYEVDIARGGYSDHVWVGDVGPWNIDDNYWNTPTDPDRPRRLYTDLDLCWNEARAAYYDDYNGGYDQYDRQVSNPGGLDLAVEIADNLGLAYLQNDWVDLTFPWEGYTVYPTFTMSSATDARADQPLDTRGADGGADFYVGQSWDVRIVLTNTGGERGEGTTIGLVAQEGLTVTRWDVYSDYPNADQATWAPNDADDNPSNPAHDDPGGAFSLILGGMAPGESKMARLTARATGTGAGLPELRTWVSHVDGYYEKADWDAAPTNVDAAQTWNGGNLRIASAYDLWDPQTQWDFEDGTSEGWWVGGAATASVTDGHLDLRVEGADPQLVSGWFTAVAGPEDHLLLRVNNGTTSADGRLYWARIDAESFAEERSAPLAFPTDAGWHDLTVALGGLPGWTGRPTRLRLDPADAASGTLLIQSVELDAAGAGDTGPPGAEVVASGEAGCGCTSGTAGGSGTALALALIGVARRRRVIRRRGSRAP